MKKKNDMNYFLNGFKYFPVDRSLASRNICVGQNLEFNLFVYLFHRMNNRDGINKETRPIDKITIETYWRTFVVSQLFKYSKEKNGKLFIASIQQLKW